LKAVENGIDERLLVEAAQHDPHRFAELYEHNFARVYAYVARRTRDRDEAEDLTAEVFHQALANLGRFEWRGVPFVAWLLGIAGNVIAARWRHNAGEQEILADGLEEAGAEDDVECRAMLAQLVDGLPADQRQVIIRRFVDQRSTREIAQELGRTEGAIKQLQFRALQTLRTKVRSTHG
jgi:RNA polymerase sigma-70 factor (ECF subfamily)